MSPPVPTCRWCDTELVDLDINADGDGMTGNCPNPECEDHPLPPPELLHGKVSS